MISLTKNRQYKLTGLVSFLLILAVMNTVSAREVVTYFHNNALGSPVAATDELGNLKWREEYLPYGERLLKQDSGTNDTWFTGKQEDKATGLTYFGARWYDPVVGRFTGIDPVGFQENNIHSFNRYAYANNNPYKYVDPDGRLGVALFGNMKGISLNDAASIGGMGNAAIIGIAKGVDAASDIGNPVKVIGKQALKKGAGIWSSTKSKSAAQNAFGHFKKHKNEFPEYKNAKQYVEGTKTFLTNPPKGTLTKTNSRGDTLRYHPKTNTFGVMNKRGEPKTMFRPKNGKKYWKRQ